MTLGSKRECIKVNKFNTFSIQLLDDEISIYYDPMIAKIICRGSNRNEALKRLDHTLSESMVYKSNLL